MPSLILNLYRSDYTVHIHLVQCLKQRFDRFSDSNSDEDSCRNVALHLALCYHIGFGVTRENQSSLDWLKKGRGTKETLQRLVNTLREAQLPDAFPDGICALLFDQGYLDMMNFAEHYRERQDLEE